MLKQHYSPAAILFVLIAIIGYGVERHQTTFLFICYFSAFLVYLFVVRSHHTLGSREISFWILASLLFRAVLLFSIPALSDDFYRFIWDGRVLVGGQSPFSETPSHYMEPSHSLSGLTPELYEKLNSKDRFSSYPPVCQLIYWISVKLSHDSIHGSVLIMKNILFIFEAATIWILRKMVAHFQLQSSAVLIYALNPLVILEITGNLHFEGVMVFFLIAAVYALANNQFFLSSAAFALSICTKLIPLLFLPLLFHALGWKKAVAYWITTAMITGIMFIPLMGEDIVHGFSTSLGYYFQRFEFNASLYYLIREAGFLIVGFNIIQYVGPGLAAVAMTFILDLAFRRYRSALSNNINPFLFTAMLWCIVVYFLSTTILHPWYIITLLAISIFTPYRFPMVWTGLIFLTYAGYHESSYEENLVLVAIEYIVVIACLLYETTWIRRTSHSS